VTPLFLSSQNIHLEIVKYLVKNRAEIEAKENKKDNRTPFHMSLQN
jgi:hypothetical protein